MNVALLNTKIVIQRVGAASDRIGNHFTVWEDYYVCHATVSGENASANGAEDEAAGTTVEHPNIDFTIRFCRKAAPISSTQFRVVFQDEIYDIIGIDHLNYKHKALKLRCRKVRR